MNISVAATAEPGQSHAKRTHVRMSPNVRSFEIRQRLLNDSEQQTLDAKSWLSDAATATEQPLQTKPKVVLHQDLQETNHSYKNLASWEGVVVRLKADTFVAVVKDLINRTATAEELELAIAELSPSEAELLKPGAVFYWNVGYKDGHGMPRQRFSTIRMRRLPPASQRDLDSIKEKSQEYLNIFSD